MKKNILFICKGHENIAGAQLYLQHIEKAFPPESCRLHFAFLSRDGTRVFDEIEQLRPLERWEYDWRHLTFIDSYRQAIALFRKIKPVFVIFNSNEDEIIPPLLAALVSRIKNRIMVVHWALDENSLPLVTRRSRYRIPVPSRYSIKTRLKRAFAYSCLNKLIFVNTVTRKAFVKLYQVRPDKCMTIYNGVDTDIFHPDSVVRAKKRESLGLLDNEVMILTTGNLTTVKGHEVLIMAVAELVRLGYPVKCFIAGQGELQGTLEALIASQNLAMKCQLLGYRDDIPQLLAAADIFCMPSLNEALGYSILEAMGAGKPVVASSVGGIPEVITNLVDGFLVKPNSAMDLAAAIVRLIEDNSLREKMGQNGIIKVLNQFSNRKMIELTSAFLREEN